MAIFFPSEPRFRASSGGQRKLGRFNGSNVSREALNLIKQAVFQGSASLDIDEFRIASDQTCVIFIELSSRSSSMVLESNRGTATRKKADETCCCNVKVAVLSAQFKEVERGMRVEIASTESDTLESATLVERVKLGRLPSSPSVEYAAV